MSTTYPKTWPEDRRVTLDDLRAVAGEPPLPFAAIRARVLAELRPLPATWAPKARAVHGTSPVPNLLRFVQDAAPVAVEELDRQLQATASTTKALKAERAQLKQLVAVAAGEG